MVIISSYNSQVTLQMRRINKIKIKINKIKKKNISIQTVKQLHFSKFFL